MQLRVRLESIKPIGQQQQKPGQSMTQPSPAPVVLVTFSVSPEPADGSGTNDMHLMNAGSLLQFVTSGDAVKDLPVGQDYTLTIGK